MAKPPVSYEGLQLGAPQPTFELEPPAPKAQKVAKPEEPSLKEASKQIVLYLSPEAAKSLKRYAVEQETRVHDILLEALDDWFVSHGIQVTVRAKPKAK